MDEDGTISGGSILTQMGQAYLASVKNLFREMKAADPSVVDKPMPRGMSPPDHLRHQGDP
jgi:hypothetical protein